MESLEKVTPAIEICPQDMEKLPPIIAVDFDGTLVDDNFPRIGAKNIPVFAEVLQYQKILGWRVILWTCRTGKYLDDAVYYCKIHGLEFDAVNKNIPEVIEMFGEDTRKVYANLYYDDKAITP